MIGMDVADARDEVLVGYVALAAGVLRRAVMDAESRGWTAERVLALRFLGRRTEDLEFWCQLAGVRTSAVVRRFAPVLDAHERHERRLAS